MADSPRSVLERHMAAAASEDAVMPSILPQTTTETAVQKNSFTAKITQRLLVPTLATVTTALLLFALNTPLTAKDNKDGPRRASPESIAIWSFMVGLFTFSAQWWWPILRGAALGEA